MKTLKQECLWQFTGTQNLYKHWVGGLLYTDGVKYVADEAGGYWFLDIVATEILPKLDENDGFISISLIVERFDKSPMIAATDGNGRNIYLKMLDDTDFPPGTWEFFLENEGVLLLPSEH